MKIKIKIKFSFEGFESKIMKYVIRFLNIFWVILINSIKFGNGKVLLSNLLKGYKGINLNY